MAGPFAAGEGSRAGKALLDVSASPAAAEGLLASPSPSATATPTELPSTPTPTPAATLTHMVTLTPTRALVIITGAGDISICKREGDDLTAALLDDIPGTLFTVGDNSNYEGTKKEYEACFGPSWGRHKERFWPAAGNHDYVTDQSAPYFEYFGARAGASG